MPAGLEGALGGGEAAASDAEASETAAAVVAPKASAMVKVVEPETATGMPAVCSMWPGLGTAL